MVLSNLENSISENDEEDSVDAPAERQRNIWNGAADQFKERAVKVRDYFFYIKRAKGKEGKPINVWKWRTMHLNADEQHEELARKNGYDGNGKINRETRRTPFGKFLSDTHLDETPQILYVLFGKMNLVGPRPTLSDEIYDTKPGLVGWQYCTTRGTLRDYKQKRAIYRLMNRRQKQYPVTTQVKCFSQFTYNTLTKPFKQS